MTQPSLLSPKERSSPRQVFFRIDSSPRPMYSILRVAPSPGLTFLSDTLKKGPPMGTETKTYDQLLEEVQALRRRVAELEAAQPGTGQVTLDPLTGLLNRNGFTPLGEKEIARARRYGHPLSLILFDLDDFAALNERYGHATGDLVLSRVAAVVGEQMRQPDSLFRSGGDELLTLLPETDMKKAQPFAERLLATVAGIQFPLPGETIHVTACAGAATFLFVEVELEALVAHAETALRTAKAMGKGSFSAYQE